MSKFLVDEGLTPELEDVTRSYGHEQSSHVVWLCKAGWKDRELKQFIVDGDWTFVTGNSADLLHYGF